MKIAPVSAAALRFVENWIQLLSESRYEDAFNMLHLPSDNSWSGSLIEEVTTSYKLPLTAGDDSDSSHVTAVSEARTVDYTPDRTVDWYEGNPDTNLGMIHHSLPINGIWSDLTAIFRLHRCDDGVGVALEDIHVM